VVAHTAAGTPAATHVSAVAHVASAHMIWIDVLKGMAMLGVIEIHTFVATFGHLSPLLVRLLSNGARGAQVFIVASAFLAFGSAARLAARHGRWAGVYVARRFARLAPLYYVAIATYLAVNGRDPNFWSGGKPISWANIAAHFAFVNMWVPSWINSIIKVEWTIGVLAVFFALVPLFVWAVRGLRSALVALVASTLLAAVLSLWLLPRTPPGTPATLWREFLAIWFFGQAPVMVAGIVAFFADRALLERPAAGVHARRVLLGAGVAALVVCALAFSGRASLAASVAFGVAGGAVLVGIARSEGRSAWLKPLAFLGRVSLGVYLFHLLVLQFSAQWVSVLTGLPPTSLPVRLLCFPIVVVVSAGIGYLSARFVEKPIAAAADRVLASPRFRPTEQSAAG